MNFITIIPARFASSRLPRKPLADINGKPMVLHVMEQARATGADRVIIATDHQEVVDAIERAGGEVFFTRSDHQSGTERLQEVIDCYNFPDDQIIINLQVDEPLIPSQVISQLADDLAGTESSMATLATPITTSEEAFNPNVVKVVIDARGYALYFSRGTIPWNREEFARSHYHLSHGLLRHIGIYAYRAEFIRRYVSWPTSTLERIEILEQLRVLWHGEKIHVVVKSIAPSFSVDTPEDLEKIRLLQQRLS